MHISTSTREVEQIIRLEVAFKVEGCRNEETVSLLFPLLCRDTLDVTLRDGYCSSRYHYVETFEILLMMIAAFLGVTVWRHT